MAKQRVRTRSLTQDKDATHERKKKRTLYAMTGILVFLMVFSIFGIMLYGGDTASGATNSVTRTTFEGYTFSPVVEETLPWEITKTPFGKGIFKGELFSEPVSGNYEAYFHPSFDAVIATILSAPIIIVTVDTGFLADNATNASEYISLIQAQEMARFGLTSTFTKMNIQTLNGITAPVDGVALPTYTCGNATSLTIEFVTTQLFDESTIDGIHIDDTNPNCIRIISSFEAHTLQITERLRFGLMR